MLRVLLVAVLLLPAGLFLGASWLSYHAHFADARERLLRTLDVVHEHAEKVLETRNLIASQVDQLLEGLSDEQITSREEDLHRRLKRISGSLDQINDIWVLDATGRPLLTAGIFPAPRGINLSDRDYFEAQRNLPASVDQTYIGTILEGRVLTDNRFFSMSSRRHDPERPGSFAGVINVSLAVKYFEGFYAEAAATGFQTMTLTRADGIVIARYPRPARDLVRIPPGGTFAKVLAEAPERGVYDTVSAFDGIARMVAYRRLEEYPLYVTAGYDHAFITNQWLSAISTHLLFGIPATAGLVLLTLIALNRTRRETIALEQVQAESARREETETRLRQVQKMDAIGRLTGGIAHDFNNLLTIVIGSLDLLRRRLSEGDARSLRLAENALDGANRAATLTLRLLAFSRQQALDPRPTDANRLVGGMSELLRGTLGETVQIETVLAGGLWQTLVDGNQLESAILNLAVNARDAMPDGGKLTIETSNAHLDEAYASTHDDVAAGQYVVICVSDTGCGMSSEIAAKAFDPFFTTKPTGQGTGLGLSQVYGFMKQSGGHAKIYSEVGQGTTIKLYLPRHYGTAATETAQEVVPEPTRAVSEGTILVVEDNASVREFTTTSLRDLGYRALEAASPSAALDVLRKRDDIVLLLTDVVMPEFSGRVLADRALQERPDLKVLFMTGYTRNAIVHNNVLDPATHLIGKPFTMHQLGAKLEELLGNPPAVSGN